MASLAPITIEIPAEAKPGDAEIDVFGVTHPGLVRKDNQDHFLLSSLHKELVVHGTSLPDLAEVPRRSERLAFFGMVVVGVGGCLLEQGRQRSSFAPVRKSRTWSWWARRRTGRYRRSSTWLARAGLRS